MSAVTTSQIAIIRTLAARAGFDDETYRDFLSREAAVRSTKQLTLVSAGRVIDRLRELTGQPQLAKGAVAGLSSPVARKMQALWIAGYNLGLIHDRTDRAMLAFLERQTGVSHTRFLSHPSEASAAIEALKSWLRRDADVEWPLEHRRGGADPFESKRAVIEAQWRILAEHDTSPRLRNGLIPAASRIASRKAWEEFESCHYDQVQAGFGRWIRQARQRQRVGA